MKTWTVFVYGTLRNGLSNHKFMENSAFLGTAKTKEPYQLRQAQIPFVSKTAQKGKVQVIGEVYEVSGQVLTSLDRLEGHPRFYRREQISVVLNKTGEEKEAWIYFCERGHGRVNLTGDFTNENSVY